MTNDEALDVLLAKKAAAQNAIDAIIKFRRESVNWLDTYKTTIKDSVKADSVIAGADLSTWDGLDAL